MSVEDDYSTKKIYTEQDKDKMTWQYMLENEFFSSRLKERQEELQHFRTMMEIAANIATHGRFGSYVEIVCKQENGKMGDEIQRHFDIDNRRIYSGFKDMILESHMLHAETLLKSNAESTL